ncbi:MAG: META domain-containing protein [Candidatus Eisenbacteria bacterium]
MADLPCVGCLGIRHQLELRPDGRYAYSLEFKRAGDSRSVEVGAGIWWISEDSTRLTLDDGVMPDGEDLRAVWQLVDRETLRTLDVHWQPRIAGGTGELSRADSLPSMWGEQHFMLFQAPLADTRWVPLRIGGKPVKSRDSQHEPWLLLDSKGRKVTGSGGCNRFTGDYDKGVQTLRMRSLAATRMACPELRGETAFLQVLEQTWGYRVTGRRLELLDEGGVVLAEFEERNR